MTLTPNILSHADSIIRELYDGLTNKGPVDSFIEASNHSADFDLPDSLKMRAVTEKNIVYFHVFRAK